MNKVLDARDRRTIPRIEQVFESIRLLFDDIEAYAYMSRGEVILRLEYELILIRVPTGYGLRDLASYLFKLGAHIYRKRRGIDFALDVDEENWVVFHAETIHVERGQAYIAIEPRRIVSGDDLF
ncbi:hypothetical protein PYJP_17800 [Pyrofollis japonicus]|uniref:hypothetical protein n=1 Tax=Pyrofollis japonicus TaxID=3060460 RepID=UPI00295B3FBE|nr:hypothetical protein [Pyrofollis japonicus]BEP18428.1 hypothetical protein PYJP_17800 [Pyrofollis japonicus]